VTTLENETQEERGTLSRYWALRIVGLEIRRVRTRQPMEVPSIPEIGILLWTQIQDFLNFQGDIAFKLREMDQRIKQLEDSFPPDIGEQGHRLAVTIDLRKRDEYYVLRQIRDLLTAIND
jgi:hypothetical protein